MEGFWLIKSSSRYFLNKLLDWISISEPLDIFISTLNSISISTTRGMMFSAFRGTFLHNAILPLIDPAFKEEDKTGGANLYDEFYTLVQKINKVFK